MGYTIAEKILSQHSHKKVKAADVAICDIDFCFAQDGTSELVIDNFLALGKRRVFNNRRFCITLDHSVPSPKQAISNIHQKLRDFSCRQRTFLFDVGCGVCHQVIPEAGFVRPGNLVVGADSHTCTYGALNALSCGLGSTDIAVTLAAGKNWFKVPETIKIIVKGKLPKGTGAKDIILYIIGQLGANGCTYLSVEFSGPVIDKLSIEGRFTISNMAVEMGAKCALFTADQKTFNWLKKRTSQRLTPVSSDKNADYKEIKEFDISRLSPQVAKPDSVDNVVGIKEVLGRKIDLAFLGTCTNGRLEDLTQAAKLLKTRSARVHPKITFVVAPASKAVYLQAVQNGIIEILLEAGAIILPAGCGACVGTHAGVPADRQTVLSTANRNFKGRMGNPSAEIFLASPLTLAASVIEGEIADPRKYIDRK